MARAQAAARPLAARARPGHLLVASLLSPDTARIASALQALPREVGLAEVRLDGLWQHPPDPDAAAGDLERVLAAAPVPLLATLRPRREGGRFEGPEEVRLGLLAAAARAGFLLLDVENDNADMAGLLRRLRAEGALAVVSRHELARAPPRDDGLRQLQAMQDLGGELHKLAFQAGAFPDALRALELAHAHAARRGRPAVAAMGFGGPLFRALLPLAGNHATYGAAPGLGPAAPGQPAIDELLAVWRHWGLPPDDLAALPEGPRPWYAVLGTPVDRSLSPRMHNAALRAAGRPERYGALDVPRSPGAFRLVAAVAARIGLAGASVTHPHKVEAARVARLDGVAAAVGAANQLRFTPAGPEGTNTDATALRRLLAPAAGDGTRAVVLGSGGAARAAVWALRSLGAQVTCASRDVLRAQGVQALGAAWVPWEARAGLRGDLWVQATPLGLEAGDPSPAAPQGAQAAVELNYKGGPTAFQRDAAHLGARVIDGRAVVLEQAVDAFRFWFGAEPDRRAMEAALA